MRLKHAKLARKLQHIDMHGNDLATRMTDQFQRDERLLEHDKPRARVAECRPELRARLGKGANKNSGTLSRDH